MFRFAQHDRGGKGFRMTGGGRPRMTRLEKREDSREKIESRRLKSEILRPKGLRMTDNCDKQIRFINPGSWGPGGLGFLSSGEK